MRNTTAVAVGAAAATALNFGFPSGVYAAGDGTLKVGLVGCGGRGSGAALNALQGDPNAKIVALGDAFKDKAEQSLKNLKVTGGARVDVTPDRIFDGLDAYKKVIEASDVVLLATPPHFRPMHLKAAIDAGKHVFCEKPVGVDAPGVRSVLETCQKAKEKNLAVLSGLCYRYDQAKQEVVKKIHDGEIGDLQFLQTNYLTNWLWVNPRKPEWSDMEWQIRNWLYFYWLSGDHIVEQHIHSLDKMLWVMKDVPPAKVLATGGRQQRTQAQYGNVYDHFTSMFEWESGVRCLAQCRQFRDSESDTSDFVYGTKGTADIMQHRINGPGGGKMRWKRRKPAPGMYDQEHVELFKSIRSGKPINSGDYMCKATMMAIMARMSAYTGKSVKWDDAWNSNESFTPKSYDFGPPFPVAPVPVPGGNVA
jgi:predicted dehydrogenase